MLRMSVIMTIMGLVTVLINAVFSRYISEKRINITRVAVRDSGKLSGTTVAGIEMIESIKASGSENGFFGRWAGYQASVNLQDVRFTKMDEYLGLLPQIVSGITDVLVLCMGIRLAMQGQFTPGMIAQFSVYMKAFLAPANTLISTGQTVQQLRTEMERIEDVMEYRIDPLAENEADAGAEGVSYAKLSGKVEMRNVTFGYAPLGKPLIQDFSMTLEPGKSVAFVGASGSGKSTLAKLLSGLHQPWSGEILFDGKPIGEIDKAVFRGSLAVVDQDITLFEDTISNNIKMWDTTIENYEVILAARDAQIHDKIMERDGGYEYTIKENGSDFSGGEKQRLEIARVLAQDPTIVIMDEATSALDARTEFNVVRSIRDRGVTTIVIAHRLSTIRDCDEIIVMDHGLVAERGTHEELYALGGLYTELVSSN
jgi:ABC-type bacteriocin/lantibiotic exporter with double-glycine peptidase domain